MNNYKTRVVLLLDLDCFYAQCEMIRLNINPNQPLCLLQWNSALAINYPARDLYKFKRGVSFEEIQSKSKGNCVALHLPVISLDQNNASSSFQVDIGNDGEREQHQDVDDSCTTGDDDGNIIQTRYDKEYNQPQHVKTQVYNKEKNVMRYPYEGKASLERYRLASAYIFETIKESLENQREFYKHYHSKGQSTATASEGSSGMNGNKNKYSDYFLLEKASIDELYLDITKICYDFNIDRVWSEAENSKDSILSFQSSIEASSKPTIHIEQMASEETFVCAKNKIIIDYHNDEEIRALQRGSVIACGIRKAVYDKLGFTLSAGISTTKLVAKLGASYGKPNGQAIVYPDAIKYVMSETPIRKARNFGGKIGKEIAKLLPPNECMMSSIEQYLSLNELTQALGNQTARIVFDACRGIDEEPVKETKGALSKSITAFKSFGPTNIKYLNKWTTLLTIDVFSRVIDDSKRNNRFPKSCTIQYYYKKETASSMDRIGHSIRTPFPLLTSNHLGMNELVCSFVTRVQELIQSKCNEDIVRLGLCAMGFVERVPENESISSFFQKGEKISSHASNHNKDPVRKILPKTKKEGTNIMDIIQKQKRQQPAHTISKQPTRTVQSKGKEQMLGKRVEAQSSYKPSPIIDATSLKTIESPQKTKSTAKSQQSKSSQSPDLLYATKLQASYDRENEILSRTATSFQASTRNKKRPTSTSKSTSKRQKMTIDSFFKTASSKKK